MFNPPLKSLTEVELAWLAGFVDGEGYIGITFQRKKETASSAPSPRYHPYLIVTNTNREVLDHVEQLLGVGHIYKLTRTLKHKPGYQYKLTSVAELKKVLKALLPYLRIKAEPARVLLNFIEYRQMIKPITGRGHRGVTSFTDRDHKFYEALQKLNARGTSDNI